MTTKISALFVSFLIACGGKSAPTTTTTTPTTTSAGTPFTIVELKIVDGNDPGIMLHTDGRIEMNDRAHKGDAPTWKTVGKLTADGKLAKPDGTEVGAFQADGTFKSTTGESAPFKFEGEVLVAGDKRITVDDKGVIQGGNAGFQLRVEGVTDAGSRRAALLLLALATAGKTKTESSGDVSVPAQVSP